MNKIIAVCTTALIAVGLAIAGPIAANAEGGQYEVCVPKDAIPAYTEVVPDIEHPATGNPTVTIDNPDYIPAVEASSQWWNFAPNKSQGPLEGAPLFPVDARGTWQGPHDNGGPGKNKTGVFQQGKGHGSWFYRVTIAGSDAQGEPTVEVANPDYVPAWTEVVPDIEHPAVDAVVCGEEPEEPRTTTPLPPLFEDVCGTANDVTRIPDNTDEYTYVGDVTEAGLSTVTATAAKGFVFDSGYDTLTWKNQFTNEACPVVVPPAGYAPTEQPAVAVPPVAQTPVAETLPETGTDTSGTLFAGGAAFLLLIAGAAALLFKRREATE